MRNMNVMKCLTEKGKSEYDLKEVILDIWGEGIPGRRKSKYNAVMQGVTGMSQEQWGTQYN